MADNRKSNSSESSNIDWDELYQNLIDLGVTVSGEVNKGLKSGMQQLKKAQERNEARKAQTQQNEQKAKQVTAQVIQQANTMARQLSDSITDAFAAFLGGISWLASAGFAMSALFVFLDAFFHVYWRNRLLDVAAGFFLSLFLSGIFGMLGGCLFANRGKRMRYRRYVQSMADQTSVPLQQLCKAVQKPLPFVCRDIKRMIQKGMFPCAYLDEEGQRFFLSEEEYRTLERQQKQQLEQQPETEQQPYDIMEQVQQFTITLQQHIETTQNDPQIHEELCAMNRQLSDLLDLLESNPQWVGKLRKFGRYYLPTMLKLLDSYDDVKNQQGETAQQIRLEIAGILHTMNLAFENLRDEILKDTVLDISTEISAMHTMLAQDGFSVNDTLNPKEQQQ